VGDFVSGVLQEHTELVTVIAAIIVAAWKLADYLEYNRLARVAKFLTDQIEKHGGQSLADGRNLNWKEGIAVDAPVTLSALDVEVLDEFAQRSDSAKPPVSKVKQFWRKFLWPVAKSFAQSKLKEKLGDKLR